MGKTDYQKLTALLEPKKQADKEWFLSLLDEDLQRTYEAEHIQAVLQTLRIVRIRPHKNAIKEMLAEIERIEKEEEKTAENYRKIGLLLAEIEREKEKIEVYRPFFEEPYFARMDLVDNVEGYNSYYIGRRGDVKLEILDWRTPVARRYYQKSCSSFTFNEYEYKTILRRAIRTKNGKVEDFKNEYLSLRDYLSAEEIGGRDEENVLDPFLREIIKNRKEEAAIKDIIETIQEKQYEIITCPEKENFVLQGCAGSGKTMVMLHRLSYLMYNNEDIKPRDVLVITPSNSFNDFIDELSEVLELERVKTTTVYDYFLRVLKNCGIDLTGKIDCLQSENKEYLSYLYSEKFLHDIQKKLDKAYDSLYGLFTGEECKDFIKEIVDSCKAQLLAYEGIKNASLKVRRCVLGEMKEKKEGGLYYTKPFREIINCVLAVEDFFDGALQSERSKNPEYFYRQLTSFYKGAGFLVKHMDSVVQNALSDLDELAEEMEKDMVNLRRFRQKLGNVEVYLYADRIARRKEILEEIVKVKEKVALIGEENTAFAEFYRYLKGEKTLSEIGSGNGFIDVVRYFYRETIKKYKLSYGMDSDKLYRSDAYALCALCAGLSEQLTPTYAYVFVDEGQDISPCEYALLRKINQKAAFNVFGDIAQNVTPFRGIANWTEVFPDFSVYELNQNYRNTNQIVDFVSSDLHLNMQSVGYDGPPIEEVTSRKMAAFFKEKKGLKAIICAESVKEKWSRKSYNDLAAKGKISKTKINFMTVYESKGLEFTSVAVITEGMSNSEKYIAYTRALKNLAVVKE